MPPAVIGLALVAADVITITTLSYIALGVTVAGMVTGNKTLQKIGGQLGLAAGVAGIATSFMGAGSSLASALKDGASVATGAVKSGGDASAAVSGGAVTEAAGLPGGTGNTVGTDLADPSGGVIHNDGPPNWNAQTGAEQMNQQIADSAARNAADAASGNSYHLDPNGKLVNDVSTAAGEIGKAPGADVGVVKTAADAAPPSGGTAGLPGDTTQAFRNPANNYLNTATRGQESEDGGFLGFLKNMGGKISGASDGNKYLMAEGGKIIAGGIQGMSTTSNMNARMAEDRRIDDIKRANAAQVARSSYGLMRA